MPSISSQNQIKERTLEFLVKKDFKLELKNIVSELNEMTNFLNKEYDLIPEKERIGKGGVYISKAVAKGAVKYIQQKKINSDFFKYLKVGFKQTDNIKNKILSYFILCFNSELAKISKSNLIKAMELTKIWADHDEWDLRETSIFTIRTGLKKYKEIIFPILKNWMHSDNENLRRVVVEAIRPMSDIRWLRDPEKNDQIIEILEYLKSDKSIYVRKSVGNNLKDLSKYMPIKILRISKQWINDTNINITDDLASKSKMELGIDNYNLIWTIKHALRWLNKKNPEYHTKIESILGKNYVQYFDEKKNKMAKMTDRIKK